MRLYPASTNIRQIIAKNCMDNRMGVLKFGETARFLASGCLDAPDLYVLQRIPGKAQYATFHFTDDEYSFYPPKD